MAQRKNDGVRIVREPRVRSSVWLLVAALGLIAAMVLLVLRPIWRADPAAPEAMAMHADPPASKPAPRGGAPEPRRRAANVVPVRRRTPDADVTPPPAADVAPEAGDAAATPADATAAEAGDERSGIALFPPPGTDPLKPGILVPEDYPLPEGYVRHYQATDTGQRVPAILMFHPDYDFFDAKGNRIEIPEDRIVPRELAPPGMPVEMLTPPADSVPMLETEDGKAPAAE